MLCFALEIFAVDILEPCFEVFDFRFEFIFFLLKLDSETLVFFDEFFYLVGMFLGEGVPEDFFALEVVFEDVNMLLELLGLFLGD